MACMSLSDATPLGAMDDLVSVEPNKIHLTLAIKLAHTYVLQQIEMLSGQEDYLQIIRAKE